jgi:hypothetical protein
MNDIPIARSEWQQFCEDFSRQHHGWLVSMSQLDTTAVAPDADTGPQRARLFTGHSPLQEVRRGLNDDRFEIMVTVGEGTEETSFLIENAVALFSRRMGDAHQGLRIDSGNGKTTLVEFRSAAVPEALDGLADSER